MKMDKYDWRVMIEYLKKKGLLPKTIIRTWSRYGEYSMLRLMPWSNRGRYKKKKKRAHSR